MPEKNLHPDVHGHRGCRGLLPENSVPSFIRAADMGCDYLELDIVLSGDGQVIVSHEPWMSGRICTDPAGDSIAPSREKELSLYRMTVEEIRRFDCGSRVHPDFPHQDLMPVHKPTLREVVEAVEEHTLMNGLVSASYNIEIKSRPEWYGVHQPEPGPYVATVIATLDSLGIADRCLLQSFDPAILEALHEQRDDFPLAYLVEESAGVVADLQRLSFLPDVYSPWYRLVNDSLVQQVRGTGMDIVVWTVNEPKDIQQMLDLGVDGIISDYPDRVLTALEGQE